jgi:hypothetical protein
MCTARPILLVCCGAALSGACSKSEPPPQRTEPWPAPALQQPRPPPVVSYSIARQSEILVSLSTREATLSGVMSVVSGSLQVDLHDLSRTRGTIRVDVTSLRMQGSGSVAESRRQTADAHNWLDIGSNQPEPERDRKRWAEFVILEIDEVSTDAAHAGKRVRVVEPRPSSSGMPREPGGSAAGLAAPRAGEVREVQVLARGELSLHGYRVEHSARLRVRFHYPTAAEAGQTPSQLTVETRSPLSVSLAAHDIKPRDSSGVFIARDVKLLGVQVARDARVSLRLTALPRR